MGFVGSISRAFVLLLLLLLILPLYLSKRALRLLWDPSPSSSSSFLGRLRMRPLAILLASAPFLLMIMVLVIPLRGDVETHSKDRPSAVSEMQEMRAKLAQLESVLDGSREMVNSKISHLNEKIKQIERLDINIQFLQDSLKHAKQPPKGLLYQEDANDMVEEVRLLWAKMRENNFDLYWLETKVEDAENNLKSVDSQLQKMKDIVTEQWIQIRHLEQALQITKARTYKTQNTEPWECSFLKFVGDLCQRHLGKYVDLMHSTLSKGKMSILWSFLSKSMNHAKNMLSHVQRYHHELQHSLKEMLESNEHTVDFADVEVACFLASAIMVFPALPIVLLFLTYFNH